MIKCSISVKKIIESSENQIGTITDHNNRAVILINNLRYIMQTM